MAAETMPEYPPGASREESGRMFELIISLSNLLQIAGASRENAGRLARQWWDGLEDEEKWTAIGLDPLTTRVWFLFQADASGQPSLTLRAWADGDPDRPMADMQDEAYERAWADACRLLDLPIDTDDLEVISLD